MTPIPPPDIPSLASSLAAEFPALDATQLSQYLGDIVEWNERASLVSKQTTAISLDRLVRQSAQLFEFITRYGVPARGGTPLRVVDIGSGAGFPGIVWKLLEPTLSVTLVERKQRKATFLERTIAVLKLAEVEVVERDAVEVGHFDRFHVHFDVAASFAVGPPEAAAPVVEAFLRAGGSYCTMRPRGERNVPGKIGEATTLIATEEREYGRFLLFRKSAA
jgi:16S rRNA (guanine527-N7)-methyltransferase